MKNIISFALLLTLLSSCEKKMTGTELLDNAITYHDPNSNWGSFDGQFNVVMETPNRPLRNTAIKINRPESYFYSKAVIDSTSTEYEVNKGKCVIKYNGSTNFNDSIAKANQLNCERAKMYKNYYSYLYGLPMKLKDPGTHISDSIEHKTFKGKDYLVLKASYDEHVGSDIWYFYFNPENYAMEIYQFFKKDDAGALNPESGEYILLTEESVINDIKMPKNRAWYYNKDDKHLGTDILQ
ncbi:MAG: hypothetical protein KC469_04355 [Flavobacteriaceae bacterium]|nr:hypothetical protein [Flavobacteriaceae bacterium]